MAKFGQVFILEVNAMPWYKGNCQIFSPYSNWLGYYTWLEAETSLFGFFYSSLLDFSLTSYF